MFFSVKARLLAKPHMSEVRDNATGKVVFEITYTSTLLRLGCQKQIPKVASPNWIPSPTSGFQITYQNRVCNLHYHGAPRGGVGVYRGISSRKRVDFIPCQGYPEHWITGSENSKACRPADETPCGEQGLSDERLRRSDAKTRPVKMRGAKGI